MKIVCTSERKLVSSINYQTNVWMELTKVIGVSLKSVYGLRIIIPLATFGPPRIATARLIS
jgi:hypothetical protein